MKKSFWIAMAVLSLGVTSCKDDVSFDQATYDELISKAFPVQNVDPNHQWATVGKATGSITVNGDYGETYKVGLYLGHPEITTSSKQLYFGEVLSGETLNVTFSHPVATDVIYIGIFDKDGRRVYMNAPIVDGHVEAVYGANSNASRRTTEAEAPQYAKTLNDYLNPSSELVGNKTVEQVTVAQMQAYDTFTDADINSSGYMLQGGTTPVETKYVQGTCWWRVPAGFNPTAGQTVVVKDGDITIGTLTFHGTGSGATSDTSKGNGFSHRIDRQAVSFTPALNGQMTLYFKGVWAPFYWQDNNGWLTNGENRNHDAYLGDAKKGHTYKIWYEDGIGFYGLQFYYQEQVKIGGEPLPGDGCHFRIASGTTITKTFHLNNTTGIYNHMVLYVEGKCHLSASNTLNSPTIVVADGGEVILDGSINISNAGRFIVMAGGKITGAKDVVASVTNGAPNYNAGTINFEGTLNLNGSKFYNNGTVNVDVLTGTSGGTAFTNFGKITANTNSYNSSAFNQTWVNGCYVHFKSGAGLGSSIMLPGSRFDIDGECRDATGSIEMHSQSLLKVGGKLFANNLTINGPTNNSEYAIVKIGGLATWGGGLQTNNRVFFDFDPNEVYDNNNPNNKHSEYNRNAVLSYIHYWVNEKNALNEITIPEGCGGTGGFNPEGNGGDPVIPEPKGFSFRYCFEDNFPDAGDYDFNDVVLTVTPKLNDKTLTIKVSLDAVGATKTLAAAIRLISLKSTDLEEYTVTQGFASPEDAGGLGSYDNIDTRETFLKEDQKPNNTSNMVIVLFKDAHWAINPQKTSTGAVERTFFNTVKPGDYYERNVDVKTATYKLVFKDADKAKTMLAENLYDVFIVEPYNGAYWEVHTVQNGFKTDQVITNRKPEPGYSNAYGSNKPWAIMVPGDFKYPYEWQIIGTRSSGVLSGAYQTAGHSFAEWAENSEDATDWYLFPTNGLVYE